MAANQKKAVRRVLGTAGILAALALVTVVAGSCSFDGLLASLGSLGGATGGQRGTTRVLFINNTPFRAIFTFGAFDDLDSTGPVSINPFSSAEATPDLEGNTQSGLLTTPCTRMYAVGSPRLIRRVREQLDAGGFDENALIEGVNFSSAAVDSDDADAPTEGKAAYVESRLGVDFECGSMLIYRLEFNDAGPDPFIVQLTIIPAKSNRGVDNDNAG